MKIKLLVWCEGYLPEQFEEDDDSFDNFVVSEVNNNNLLQSFEKDNPFHKMQIVEFEVPDNLDKQLIRDICSGKAYQMWFEHQIDSYQDYHASWAFVEKNKKWENILLEDI